MSHDFGTRTCGPVSRFLSRIAGFRRCWSASFVHDPFERPDAYQDAAVPQIMPASWRRWDQYQCAPIVIMRSLTGRTSGKIIKASRFFEMRHRGTQVPPRQWLGCPAILGQGPPACRNTCLYKDSVSQNCGTPNCSSPKRFVVTRASVSLNIGTLNWEPVPRLFLRFSVYIDCR